MAAETTNESPIEKLLSQDPGLPRPKPTQAYWQNEPHPLAETQSPTLPTATDVAIIGSGISGVSVAKAILEQSATSHVTVFEARTLCSGATGRNGGQLAINAAESYRENREIVGAEMAGKIVQYNIETLKRMRELAREFAQPDPELVEVTKIRSFKDTAAFEQVKQGINALVADHPSLENMYSVIDAETCEHKYGVFGVAGGIMHPAGTVWPYRLVTGLFDALLKRYSSRLAIETYTPVREVSYDPEVDSAYPYFLQTARGIVRCSRVAYCTNAYTGHLLPRLRGLIFPLKGTMTVQDVGLSRRRGDTTSWAIHYSPFVDSEDGTVADGLIYGLQNAKTGNYFFGGEKASITDMLSADDSKLSPSSVDFLQHSLWSLFGLSQVETDKALVQAWSGIMGFSSDGMPLVGRLPKSITGREGSGEWICAAFNGYGMPNACLAAESLGLMILGGGPHSCMPEAYLITEARLKERLSLSNSVAKMQL